MPEVHAAAVAGALVGVVASGHLMLAALGTGSDRAARIARVAERVMLGGWTITAAVPATVFALMLVAAWNMDGVGPLVYDTPLVVVLCHVGRFGVVGAWIGRLAALREPRERRDLRCSVVCCVAAWCTALQHGVLRCSVACSVAALLQQDPEY